ncbi:MAG TPA: zinc ribbon domain-containing protein [Rhodanobacteraceae bacterium]|nr:zinc ribbon domain-containing protein [Rhodanobacteraceae bacterium]
MTCPKCQYPNAEGARFCVQCGASMTQAAAAPAASAAPAQTASVPPSSGNRTALIVLGVIFGILLLFVVGIYTAFHMVANKVRALASGDEQTSSQSQETAQNGSDSDTQQASQTTGNVIGNILGTDAKGKSDIGKAIGNMAQAGQQIEQHDKAAGNANGTPDAADTQAAMNAAGGLLGALGHSFGGAHRHDPVDFHSLEALLPSSLSGMQRGTPRGEANQAMGLKATSTDVDFTGANNARINVSIKDATAVSGLAGMAEMANSEESEQGDNYEKNETIDGRSVHEKWDAQDRHGELSLLVGKRFGVDITGDNVGMDALKNALAQIDLGKLESMKDANPTAQ